MGDFQTMCDPTVLYFYSVLLIFFFQDKFAVCQNFIFCSIIKAPKRSFGQKWIFLHNVNRDRSFYNSKIMFLFREKMVVVKGESTQHLRDLHLMAEDLELPSFLVKDAGITQVPSGAVTVFGVFGEDDDVNKITGRLKLM